MKKILIAFDGTQFSEGAFEFAKKLNELNPVFVAGVFMPQTSYASLWNYSASMTDTLIIPFTEDPEGVKLDRNIERFRELCTQNHIKFAIHKDYNDFALPELKRETRFADLLIISSEKFFEKLSGKSSDYLRDAVHEAECPVIVIPEKFDFPKQNVIAFDGSPSSVHAMKQFAYLFPELCKNETLLVYSKEEEDLSLPNEEYIEELANLHFKNFGILKLKFKPEKYFNTWLKDSNSPILICGAFGRSAWSEMFKKSFVTDIIADHRLPVFITHL